MKNPFVAGNWVRGSNFFGRQPLIHEILDGNRDYLWVAGTRRFGKTSTLKQIELLTSEGEYAEKYISLFWDIQGSQDIDGLKESLLESVEDAEERFMDLGVTIDALEEEDVFGILRKLRKKAKDENLKLLLLCDECEELINIEKKNPEALPKLRRAFQQGENVRTVLAATKRLSILENSSIPQTSPFLYGFVPPTYLTRLEDDEAKRLIKQGNFDDETVYEIMDKTNNHPYLIQLICRRLYETPNLSKVIEEVSMDDMIGHFFAVDFQNLQPKEAEILLHILQNQTVTLGYLQSQIGESAEQLIRQLYGLIQLGAIKQQDGHYLISNYFFETWLQREKEKLFSDSTLKRAQPTLKIPTPIVPISGLPEVGQKLGNHEILAKIGSGGMGTVFKGKDLKLNRTVAIKILRPDLMNDPEFRERFIVEAQSASAMNHPNIATIYQLDEQEGVYFIVMEFIEGQNLRVWQKAHPDDVNKALDLAIQAGKGLAHAHSKNIIHRDIKSDNIMITHEGVAKIMDFGLAKSLKRHHGHITKTGTTLGTLCYMSPEQASGLPTDHRSDIFSFGVLLYELFTGELPFAGDFELTILYSILNEEPRPLRQVKPDLPAPAELENIVSKALQKNKEKRYQSMDELVEDLEKLRKKIK
jgi:predicted Ser/Thr protein kinase